MAVNRSVSSQVLDYLNTGKLCVDRATADAMNVHKLDRHRGEWTAFLLKHRTHLLPLGVDAPTCTTCAGSGKTIAHLDHGYVIGRSPWRSSDFLDSDYSHTAHDEVEQCWDCKGSGVPSQLVLTVECEKCGGSENLWKDYWSQDSEPCDCDGGSRPVCRVEIDQILPIVRSDPFEFRRGWPSGQVIEVTTTGLWLGVSRPGEWSLFNVEQSLSHLLLPGIEWVGWAALVRLETL